MLNRSEELILVTVRKLRGTGYGHLLIQAIEQATEGRKSISPGSLHQTLDRLEAAGYVTARRATVRSELGKRDRVVYRISDAGLRALAEAEQAREQYDGFVPSGAKA